MSDELGALAADLGRAPEKVLRQASQVVRKSGLALQNHARSNAPVDTGFLVASITGRITNQGLRVDVDAAASYAHFLEHGTIYIEPIEFMGGALESVRPSFEAAMQQVGVDIL